jgi:C4-dicarboxylate-specific signal transduction histidine kinase
MPKKPTYKELQLRVEHLERQARKQKQAEKQQLQRERLRGVLEMAGAVCHELNQPMQVLSAYCERSLRTKAGDNPLYNHMQSILEKIDTMTAIVRKLENIATYETKDYIEGKKIIDIDKACQAA